MGIALIVAFIAFYFILRSNTRGRERKARQAILEKYAIYRKQLPPDGQKRYDGITHHFAEKMEWEGRGVEVVEEMRTLISGCAAQIMLNLPDTALDRFHTMYVYKNTWRSLRTGKYHQGEVRPLAGVIVLSWDNFVFGYSRSHDGENVGLHELAHALWFEHLFLDDSECVWPQELVKRWQSLADEEIKRIKSGKDVFFGRYAASNQAEFFAVSMELFFEKAEDFRSKAPELHGCMAALLRQDPSGISVAQAGPGQPASTMQ